MPRPLRVLHLEDSPRDAQIIRDRLELDGVLCDIVLAHERREFEAALAREEFDLIISDYNLPDYDGITALKRAQATQPDVPVILISGTVDEEQAVRCLHIGATDYLLKARLDRLAPAVHRAIREADTRRTQRQANRALQEREQTLRENEERTSFVLAAARMGVWEIDLATGRLTWSDTMAPLHGLTPQQVPKTREEFVDLIHPDDRDALAASMARTLAGERAPVVEFRTIWPDGTAHWIHGRAQALYDDAGKPIRLLGIAMDIDDRKQLEEQLHQSQKLEAIGQLAGGVAHDFNNVLTVILGFSELRLFDLASDDPARDDLLEITKAANRAAGLTRQLLAFSRKQMLHPQVLDVNALIGGVQPMLRQLIAEHVGLTITLTARHALIKMDPTQLEQILVNLAVNAAHAMPRGGTLTIETANVTLDEHYLQRNLPVRPGNHVLLSVRDTGTGMDDATLKRMFEPFFTTKPVGTGTGLGLATVYGIIKQSGGDISVDSTVGRGTTFNIYLPQASGDVQTLAASDRPSARDVTSRRTETILLVEDNEAVRRLTRITLERIGYHVLQAENPKVAAQVAAAYAGPIDLMLSDVIMPESDGPPLFGELLAVRPAIRALYMSGYADEAIQHVLLTEDTPFIQKPFTPDVLARKVRDVLDAAPAPQSPL